MSYAERNMVDMARPEAMAQTAEIERLRAALAMARVSLKGARGLALDTDELQFDSEFARAIDRIDAALEPTDSSPDWWKQAMAHQSKSGPEEPTDGR
jgi:hypothetical protein